MEYTIPAVLVYYLEETVNKYNKKYRNLSFLYKYHCKTTKQ